MRPPSSASRSVSRGTPRAAESTLSSSGVAGDGMHGAEKSWRFPMSSSVLLTQPPATGTHSSNTCRRADTRQSAAYRAVSEQRRREMKAERELPDLSLPRKRGEPPSSRPALGPSSVQRSRPTEKLNTARNVRERKSPLRRPTYVIRQRQDAVDELDREYGTVLACFSAKARTLLQRATQPVVDPTQYRLSIKDAAALYTRGHSLVRAPMAAATNSSSSLLLNNTLAGFGGLDQQLASTLLYKWAPRQLSQLPSAREVYLASCNTVGVKPCPAISDALPITIGRFDLQSISSAGHPIGDAGVAALIPLVRLAAATLTDINLRAAAVSDASVRTVLRAVRQGLRDEARRQLELRDRRIAHLRRVHGAELLANTSLDITTVTTNTGGGGGTDDDNGDDDDDLFATVAGVNSSTPLSVLLRWGEDAYGVRDGEAPITSVTLAAAQRNLAEGAEGGVGGEEHKYDRRGLVNPKTRRVPPSLETFDVSSNAKVTDQVVPALVQAVEKTFHPSLVHVAVSMTGISRAKAEVVRDSAMAACRSHTDEYRAASPPAARAGSPPRRKWHSGETPCAAPPPASTRNGFVRRHCGAPPSGCVRGQAPGPMAVADVPQHTEGTADSSGVSMRNYITRAEFKRAVGNFRSLMSAGTGVCDFATAMRVQPTVANAVGKMLQDSTRRTGGVAPPSITKTAPASDGRRSSEDRSSATQGAGPGGAASAFTFIDYLRAMYPAVKLQRLIAFIAHYSEYVLVAAVQAQRATNSLLIDQRLELYHIFESLIASSRQECIRVKAEELRPTLADAVAPSPATGKVPPPTSVAELDAEAKLLELATQAVDASFDRDVLSPADLRRVSVSAAGADAAVYVLERAGHKAVDREAFAAIAAPYIVEQRRRKRFR